MTRFMKSPQGKQVFDETCNTYFQFATVESEGFRQMFAMLNEPEQKQVFEQLDKIYQRATEKLSVYNVTPTQFDYEWGYQNVLLKFHVLVGYIPLKGNAKSNRAEIVFCYCRPGEIADALERVFTHSLILFREVDAV